MDSLFAAILTTLAYIVLFTSYHNIKEHWAHHAITVAYFILALLHLDDLVKYLL